MTRIKFYLDENVANAVAEVLRTRDIDVLTTPEAGRQSLPDEDHLAFALLQQRVLVTQDEDFLILASKTTEHAGIAYYKP
jgi:predicted nuclease of predicted toxin-antitoxin system